MNDAIMKTTSHEFQKWLDRLAKKCANRNDWRDLLFKISGYDLFWKTVNKELIDIGFQPEEREEILDQFKEQIKEKQENKMFVFTDETAYKILAFCLLSMRNGIDDFETIYEIRDVIVVCELDQSLFDNTVLKRILLASEELHNYRTNPNDPG